MIYEKLIIDMSNISVVESMHSKGNLVRQQTGSSFLGSTPLLDEDQTQFYLTRALHGYQLWEIEAPEPGTANINHQGFVFAVPGFLVSASTYERHARARQEERSQRGNPGVSSTDRVLSYSYRNRRDGSVR